MKNWVFLLIFFTQLSQVPAKNIVLTIDDFPMGDGPLYSLEERTDLYLDALEKQDCPAVFFCIGSHCKEEISLSCLSKLSDKGHEIANHSMNHWHLSSITLKDFEKEIKETETLLKPYSTFKKWFRYPFLDYGNQFLLGGSTRKAVQGFELLKRLQYKDAYVTINTFDWHLNERLKKAIAQGWHVNYDKLKEVYLSLINDWTDFYFELFETHLKKEFTHTFLLHANDLNALTLEDILVLLKKKGLNFVKGEEAFEKNELSKLVSPSQRTQLMSKKPKTLDIKAIDEILEKRNVFTR